MKTSETCKRACLLRHATIGWISRFIIVLSLLAQLYAPRSSAAAAGGLDRSFGSAGVVRSDLSGGVDDARAMAIDSGGRMVVAGTSILAGDTVFAVARYNADGSLDPTFGSAGKAFA